MKALWLIALAGCLDSTSVVCGDQMICPDDQVCAHVTDPDQDLCADPAQLQACEGRPTYARCGANGRCYDGVCLPVSCGNGRVDRADPADPTDEGEVCDDHNERSGDGCSSDCRSDETCGNSVIDPVELERCDDGDRISHDGCDSVCQPERARWHELVTSDSTRFFQALSYDLMADRTLMFGGALEGTTSDDVDETWEISETGFTQLHPPTAPSPRSQAAMAYDVERRRTVLFGGAGSGETWTWDGTAWSEALLLVSPSPREAAAMVYDIRRKRLVLFGGRFANHLGTSNETWEWDGVSWTRITTPTVPGGRSHHAMAYDPSRGVTVMWSGQVPDPKVWEYDGVDWHAVEPPGHAPDARFSYGMAYDPVRRRVMIVGGKTFDTTYADAWSWDGQTWEAMPSPDPLLETGYAMATDVRHDRVLLMAYGRQVVGTRWWWDGAAWTSAMPRDLGETLIYGVSLDPLRGRIVGTGRRGLCELDGVAWVAHADEPSGHERVGGAIAYDPGHRESVLFGGSVDNEVANDTWTWNGEDITAHDPATPPPPRLGHAMAFDARHGRIVMFGGRPCDHTPCDVLDDTWEWDGAEWHLANPVHRPPGRSGMAFGYDPIHEVIVMFGGMGATDETGASTRFEDTWTWNGEDWTEQHPVVRPSARAGAAVTWSASRQRLLLLGGESDAADANDDVWEFDGAEWTRVAVSDSPARVGASLAQGVGAGVTMFGGATAPGAPATTIEQLRWDGNSPTEACRSNVDSDGDGLAGCADPDCWWACAPLCPPGAPCDPAAPHCGDGVCNAALEDGWICPADCVRPVICGDAICDPGESCPGDCP